MFGWYKRISLATRILVAMVIGLVFGFVFKGYFDIWGQVTTPIGDIFIRLLRMVILPLIFFSIISGIASVVDLNRLKRIGGIFVGYWFISSLIAASMGLIWAFIIRPGVGIQLEEVEEFSTEGVNLLDSFVRWIPDNVFAAFAQFNILQLIVFSILLGLAIAFLGKDSEAGQFLVKAFNAGTAAIMRLVSLIMEFAPIGVLALMANVTGTLGVEVLTGLTKMLATQYVAYAMVIIIVYPIILKFIARVNPLQHFRNIYPAMVLAFSTCSSSATLPLTMKVTHERAGVPETTVGLIAPAAATINMHAVAAEMAIYAVFASQIYNINLSFGSLITIIILGVIMAAGCAGVPGGGIMMSAILLEIMGLPLTIVPWIAGIYRLIDMPNTMLNVTGDTVGMVTTSALVGELDRDVFNAVKHPGDTPFVA